MSDATPSPDGPSLPRLGSYKILRQLGAGGMSNVFQAVHIDSGSLVALKVLPRKLAQSAILLQRFLREAKSAENLDHPNIVAIYDRGFDQGRHYLVLEFVEGRDLFERVRLNGPMTAEAALPFIREVALGLQYAAQRGMIHRDVKPANLLIGPDGRAKIIDLGLALQADEEDERVTRDGTTVGTVDYMSPEQARDSRKLNERSDIYSLGCTFYYLLTGSPPFPGGNLADKLARHHSAAVPDVRELNLGLPISLAQLIQRMMAKKPDQRFATYDDLIQALDQVGTTGTATPPPTLSDVLIDDSDEDDDVLELTIATETIEPPARPPRLPAPDRPRSRAKVDPAAASSVPLISLADLAALDSDEPAPSSKRRGVRSDQPANPQSSVIVEALLEPDEEGTVPATSRRSSDELPLQTWIAAGLMVGVLLVTLGFGVRFALSYLRPAEPETSLAQPDGPSEPAPTGPEAPVGREPTQPGSLATPGSVAGVKPVRPSESISKPNSSTMPAPVIQHTPAREVPYAPELLSRLGFSEHDSPPVVNPGGKVVVRRLADPNDPTQTNSLTNALGRPNEDVEIADIGPFQEDNFQVGGKTRIIKGRAGYRPIIKVEFTRQVLIRDQPAKFILGATGVERLTLDGVDLVVDVRDLPLNQTTLFLCQGVDLTIRNCTITIANAEDRRNGFSVFRLLDGPRPNRLRIEQSLIRGPILTLAEVNSGQTEINLDRTVVVGATGPLFQFQEADLVARSVRLSRGCLVTRGPVFQWNGKPSPIVIRSLGTTFARVDPAPGAPWMLARNSSGLDPKAWLDYDGDANRWVGWSTLAQWGPVPGAARPIRDDLRAVWPMADKSSQVNPASWPVAAIATTVTAGSIAAWLPDQVATLGRVATPNPHLLELTVDLFARLPTPELAADFATELTTTGGKVTIPLSFDADASPRPDLGLFLKERVIDPAKRYLVRVRGTGRYPMTPVRLPDGASLVLIGTPGVGSNQPIPVFAAATPAAALIEVHHGDLAINHLGFGANEAIRTRHWLLVEESLLALRGCTYRDTAVLGEQGGAAIRLIGESKDWNPPRAGAFVAVTTFPLTDLRDCWLSTSATAVDAELHKGVVRLENCLIQAGEAAFRLRSNPASNADRAADLILNNCTLAADRFTIQLDEPDPPASLIGRPWLVISRSSIFPRTWRDGGALLGVGPNLFARGGLFWQSSNNLYEVNRFLASTAVPVGALANPSADLKRHWIDLWGINHTRGDRGPDARRIERIINFRDKDRVRTSRPTLSQLELDPKLHADQGVNFKELPPIPRP